MSFSEFMPMMSCWSILRKEYCLNTHMKPLSTQVICWSVISTCFCNDFSFCLISKGLDPESLKGTNTGFYFGSCFQEVNCLYNDPTRVPGKAAAQVTRISKYFQFKGPIVQTDTACGSSFTALVEAFNELSKGVCDRAIVCGSNTLFRPRVSLQFRDLKMIVKDGKCKCLDAGVCVIEWWGKK